MGHNQDPLISVKNGKVQCLEKKEEPWITAGSASMHGNLV